MSSQIHLTQPLIESPRSCCWTAGWLAGPVMTIKNEHLNSFGVEMLNVQPNDQVLEIGFGQGHAIYKIAERAPKGLVAGVDISDGMVRQAAKRNREFIKSGRVELNRGNISDLPYEYARFNKVLAVDNYQFWPHAEFNLGEIQRVLREDGLLVLCLRTKVPHRWMGLAPGFSSDEVQEIAGLVRWVGFRDVKIVENNRQWHTRNDAACVIARR